MSASGAPKPPVAPRIVRPRSEQLERVAREADRKTRYGFELASRKAYLAARSEFVKALRLVAQGLDTEHRSDLHSRSLAAGLTALKEADDFIPGGSRLEADLGMLDLIGGHRTPVLKDAEGARPTAMEALNCYFTFAQEQLATAAGHEVAGSMALHGLGKLHTALARRPHGVVQAAEPKAIVFYQAALLADPGNSMAANDLGVLLARCGDYQRARAVLEHGLSMYREPTSWHNLAVVYRQLGWEERARRADALSAAARRQETARRRATHRSSHPQIRWVDPNTFAQSYDGGPAFAERGQANPSHQAARREQPGGTDSRSASVFGGVASGWRWPWQSANSRK